MSRFAKLLTDIDPQATVAEVARQALEHRLSAIEHFLSQVAGKQSSAGDTHQLRVWTRRASAALRLFAPVIPSAHQQRMQRLLRKVRRLAGKARDGDILLERLESSTLNLPHRLRKKLAKEHKLASNKLRRYCRKVSRQSKFARRACQLTGAIGRCSRPGIGPAAMYLSWVTQQLLPLGNRFLELAAEDLQQREQLHEFRITAKRLRYALELAAPALATEEIRQIDQDLTSLQDRLGLVSDGLAAVDRLSRWLEDCRKKKHRRQLLGLLEQEENACSASHEAFLRWWTADQQSLLEMAWRSALAEASLDWPAPNEPAHSRCESSTRG